MVPGASLTEKADRLREWGYDAIAVFQPQEEWNDEVRRELVALEARTGVRPVEFVLTSEIYGNAMAADERLRAACRQMYREAVDVCSELGLVTEIEFEYGPQDPMPLFDPYQQMTTDQEEQFIEFYRELLGRAEGSSASVLLEPLNRYESRYLNSVEDNLKILAKVDHPNAGLLPPRHVPHVDRRDKHPCSIDAGRGAGAARASRREQPPPAREGRTGLGLDLPLTQGHRLRRGGEPRMLDVRRPGRNPAPDRDDPTSPQQLSAAAS